MVAKNVTMIRTSEHTGIYGNYPVNHDTGLTLTFTGVAHSSCETCLNTAGRQSMEPSDGEGGSGAVSHLHFSDGHNILYTLIGVS